MDSAVTKRTPGKFARFLRDFFSIPKDPRDYGEHQCACHQALGDEFWQMPLDTCHRPDGCDYRPKPFKARV